LYPSWNTEYKGKMYIFHHLVSALVLARPLQTAAQQGGRRTGTNWCCAARTYILK
jgi:hypothetical protein